MTDREALLAAALDNPTDDTARLVLADFLQEHGEPELGRFLWAGVIAARFRFRGPEPDERADQAAALAEIVAQVRDRNPVGWVAALGLGPQPPTPTDGAAEHITDDRVSVRIGATSAEFERDMLIALSLTLGEWSDIAGRLLVAWPVERVTVRDVPGMAFWVEPPADDRPGWELSASLTVQPRRPVEHGFWRGLLDWIAQAIPPEVGPPEPLRWSAEEVFPDRAGLVGGIAAGSSRLAGRWKDEAGGCWPAPRA